MFGIMVWSLEKKPEFFPGSEGSEKDHVPRVSVRTCSTGVEFGERARVIHWFGMFGEKTVCKYELS